MRKASCSIMALFATNIRSFMDSLSGLQSSRKERCRKLDAFEVRMMEMQHSIKPTVIPMTLAIAAPLTPIFGNGPMPLIRR